MSSTRTTGRRASFPRLLHYGGAPRPGTIMTVHNLSFQGQFPRELLARIGLPPHAYTMDGVEYHGSIGYLKAGLALADRITTVSPTYAAEIRTPDGGMGLDGLLRTARRRADRHPQRHRRDGVESGDGHASPRAFDAKRLQRRAANKAALQSRFGLDADPATFVLGVVSRLDVAEGHGPAARSVAGDHRTRRAARAHRLGRQGARRPHSLSGAPRHPGRVAAIIGYDEAIAHLVQAGADALLVPSRFEPCGLTQLCALRYGAIPIVARVGGLADTVVDANEMALAAGAGTGIQFAPVTRGQLELAIGRAGALRRDRMAWRRMQLRAMATDVGWTRPAKRYAALFRALVARARLA